MAFKPHDLGHEQNHGIVCSSEFDHDILQKSFLGSRVHVSSDINKGFCKIPPLAKNSDGGHFDRILKTPQVIQIKSKNYEIFALCHVM
jgi:hypothetical protein